MDAGTTASRATIPAVTSRVVFAVVLAAVVLACAEPRRVDRLVVGMGVEPPHLDPTAGAAAAIDEIVYANVFEGLTKIGRDGRVRPALAESWTISEDHLTYTFSLRSGVTFHDGTSFDADDVRFSLKRALADGSTNAQKGLFEPVDKVTVIDSRTVEITLGRPSGRFLWNLGWGDAVIVAPESADGNKTRPIGTGPFRFERWWKGDRVKLVRHEGYWGERVALGEVVFRVISDPSAAVAALLAGDIDAFPNFTAPESLEQFADDPAFEVVIGTTEGETLLALNNARPPFDDVRVRRALAHAVDREAVLDGSQFSYGVVIGSHFAPHHPAYVDLTGLYPHDPVRARELLAEAGLGDGFKARVKLPPQSYARRSGEIIAAQLATVGVEIEIVPVEWAQWLEDVFRNADYDLTVVSHTEPMDIGIYVQDGYYFNYRDGDLRAILDELEETVDEDARYELMAQAQRKIADDAVHVFLFQLAKHGVWRAGLTGMWENSPVQANDLTEVYWAE